jgi:hypothetical protein
LHAPNNFLNVHHHPPQNTATQVHAQGLLRYMLTQLTGQGAAVPPDAAAAVELRCLEGLQWRLGPYFAEDALP